MAQKTIILQKKGPRPPPPNVKASEDDVKKSLIEYLEDPDQDNNPAKNAAFEEMLHRLAEDAAREAAEIAATYAAERVARTAYLEQETLVPPNENLTVVDINLVEGFIRNPGTGPILMFFMIVGYGGLVDEITEEEKEKSKPAKFLENIALRIKEKAEGLNPEDVFNYLSKDRSENGDTKSFGEKMGETLEKYWQKLQDVKALGKDPEKAKEELEGAMDQIQGMQITNPWHIAFLPIAMLLVQFSYIFFIFYEAWKGYNGGVCPAFQAWLDSGPQPGATAYPYGANGQIRVLMGFIASFFCVRVFQQLIAFAHALEGQHTDGALVTQHAPPAFKYGFIPNFQTWDDIFASADDLVDNAEQNLPRNSGARVNFDDNVEKGVKAYLAGIYDYVRNLSDMAYDKERVRLEALGKKIENLERLFVAHNFLTQEGLDQAKNLAKKRASDCLKPPQDRAPDSWRNIKWSWLFPFYIADCVVQLTLLICVFMVNLFIVFIDGVSARDMVLNVMMLDFIYEQLPKFKMNVFKSEKAKALLRTLKVAHNDPPKSVPWKMQCRFAKNVGLQLILVVSFVAFLVSFAIIIYGPLCKPGPDTAGVLPKVSKGKGGK